MYLALPTQHCYNAGFNLVLSYEESIVLLPQTQRNKRYKTITKQQILIELYVEKYFKDIEIFRFIGNW